MTTQHTPEPWSIAEESFDNGGIKESVIRGLDGRAAIAVTLDFGPNNPGMREANARRIVACVNACAGVDTELLEAYSAPFSKLREERDELLAALEGISVLLGIDWLRDEFDQARDVIAKAKGGAA